MKLICVMCLMSLVVCDPQLDLPRVKSTNAPRGEGPEVLVLPNSYTDDEKQDIQVKSDSSYGFESDRSSRFGSEVL